MFRRKSRRGTVISIDHGKSFMENIRCTLVGNERVGKTSMLMSYHADTYPVEYVPTIFDSYSRGYLTLKVILQHF